MGNSEPKDEKMMKEETSSTQAAKKPRKRGPIIAAVCTAAAVVCIGTVATLIAVNSGGRPATEAAAEAGSQASDITRNDGQNYDASLIDGPVSQSDGQNEGSKQAEASKNKKENSKGEASKAPEVKRFGKKVSVQGVRLDGKTFEEAQSALQGKVNAMKEPVAITVTCDGGTMSMNENSFSYASNLDDVLNAAYRYSKGETVDSADCTVTNGVADFRLKVWISEASIDDAIRQVTEHFDNPPVDAHVKSFNPDAKEKFTYENGHDGYTVDHELLSSRVREILAQDSKQGSIALTLRKTAFKVTLADVKANTKLIASHHTTAANVWASNYNMSLALKAASGTVLKPGEIFSFNQTTGNTANGDTHYYSNGTTGAYLPSTAIVGGKYETQYGGGICQAATTLYIAAMKANMEPVERYAHAYPSIYAERGLDATIDYGSLDMKFKNTLKYPVYIATYVYDVDSDGMDELMVEFYGPISTEYDEVVPVGWVTSARSSGYSATGAKVYFKNGREVGRQKLIAGSYDYKYDNYYSVQAMIPYDVENGPAVSPTGKPPRIYSPVGCGSCAPIPYGTAEEYLKNAKEKENNPHKPETSKPEASKPEQSKPESSKPETSKPETSKPESSKPEQSKPETSKPEVSKPENSRQESSKEESSRQEFSKEESSRQESSEQSVESSVVERSEVSEASTEASQQGTTSREES